MGHRHYRPRKFRQIPLQPRHALGVQMVSGLVEQQHVGFFQQNPAERHAPLLTARKIRHLRFSRREAKRIHRDLDLPVQLPQIRRVDLLLHAALIVEQLFHLYVAHWIRKLHRDLLELSEQIALRLHRFFHVLEYVLRRIELRHLRQVGDSRALVRPCLTLKVVVHSGHDAEQRGFSRAIRAKHADLGAGIKRQPDAAQDLPRWRDDLAQVLHYVDELWRH